MNRTEYREANEQCEYSLAVGWDFDFYRWAGLGSSRYHAVPRATEVDHVFGRQGKPEDVEHPSNWMAANSIAHKWKTENDLHGRIVALHWKWQQGGENWEPDRMSRVFGQDVLGWLSNKLEGDLPMWVRLRGEEVLWK